MRRFKRIVLSLMALLIVLPIAIVFWLLYGMDITVEKLSVVTNRVPAIVEACASLITPQSST